MVTKVIIPVIVVAAAVGVVIGLWVTRKDRGDEVSRVPNARLPEVRDQGTQATGLSGKIVVLTKDKELSLIDLSSSARTPITKDEKLRFVRTAPQTGYLFTLTSPAATTAAFNLYDPSTGKSTKLADHNLSGSPPVISPDGKHYLALAFSNFEIEFGWHIYLNTIGTSGKQEIFATPESLAAIAFSPDSNKVAFAVSKGKGSSHLTVVDLAGQKKSDIYTTNGEILALSWGGDSIFLIEAPKGKGQANNAEIVSITGDGKDKKTLTKNDRAENFVAASPDGKLVAYLSLTYPGGNVTPELSGTVTVELVGSDKVATYGEAIQVAGFTK